MADISKHAVLVDFGFSMPKLTAVDRKATSDTISATGAKRGAARVVKNLYSADDIKPLTRFRDEVRTYHNRMTLPWMSQGTHILPSDLFMDYSERMRAYRGSWDKLVAEFVGNYTDRRDRAINDLGSMGKESDYPSSYSISEAFEMRVNILPVPTSGDFRVEMSAETLVDVQANLVAAQEQAVAHAMEEVKDRLHKTLSTMASNLTRGAKIFDTVVTNITDLCAVLPAFNLTNDPRLEELRNEIISKLNVHPDLLRSDDKLAVKTGESAQAIIDKMSDYFG